MPDIYLPGFGHIQSTLRILYDIDHGLVYYVMKSKCDDDAKYMCSDCNVKIAQPAIKCVV